MTAKSRVSDVARTLTPPRAPTLNSPDETDVLDTLKSEHNHVKDLLQQLSEAREAALRRQLVDQIHEALVPHSKAEEEVVYDAIIALQEMDAQIDGHEGYLEHALAARTLERLAKMADADTAEHRAMGKVLKELVEHHIQEEERSVWKDVRANFSDEDRQRMNDQYVTVKARVGVH